MNSAFSDFIRNATPEEREAVYHKVLEKATQRQQETLAKAKKR